MQQQAEERSRKSIELEAKRIEMEIKRTQVELQHKLELTKLEAEKESTESFSKTNDFFVLIKGSSCVPLDIPPKAILLTVSCGNTYGSNCVFGCQTGYGSVDGNVTRTCLQTGQWSRNPINCTDVHPPTFGVTCPTSPLLAYAERGKFSALVTWNEPNATDNSGATPSLSSNHKPPQRFSQGTHVITYTAVDLSGNRATCFFAIKLVVISCTSLSVSSGGELRMSRCGSYFGAHCNFTCAIGYHLNGSSALTCVAPSNKPPGYWDNPLPTCQAIRCPSLSTPTSGVKTGCTDLAREPYNTQCSFSCNVGYNLIGSSVRRCLENGTWSGETSYCRVITCDPLGPPSHGVLHVSPSSCLLSSPYGHRCIFTCQTPGYVLEGTPVRVCGNDGQWTGLNSTNCRDNTPPSFNDTCPDNMVFYAMECSSSALLTWTEPLAADNSGHVSISYPAIRPPVNLIIGLYNVLYSATDSSGNRANCTFIVQVARKSCPVLQPPIHGSIASLSCGTSFGSQASLSCHTGYRMAGSPLRSCRADGTWSDNVTTCNIVKCPSIAAPSHGKVFPSTCQIPSGVNYKSECFFMCNVTVGYQLQGASKVFCLESGSWSDDTTMTICRDIQAPSITCPPDMDNIPTEPGQSYASVQWQLPVSTDNSNEPLTLTGLRPPQKLNIGKRYITYTVTDSSGLSRGCVFVIHIKDLEPPKIVNCPGNIHKTSKEKWTKIFFPGVTVTDNVGVHLFTTSRPNGSEFTWGENNVTYTASDNAGNTAKCHFQIVIVAKPCDDLPTPQNGAKACDKWLVAGKICTIHCNVGYDFANKPPGFYACGAGGKWMPHDQVPDCSKTRQAETLLASELHYLASECTEEMHSRIAINFIALYTRYLRTIGGCDGDVECTVENVEVECGGQSGTLRRRDVADGEQPSKVPLTVKFGVKVPLPSNASVADLNQTTQQISNDILASLNETDLTLTVSGIVLEYDTTRPPVVRILGLVCDKGQVLKGTKCVNCPLGYFFNSSGCQACVEDHYQDQEAQNECVTCPSGTSTFGQTGSKESKDCQEIPNPSSTEKQVISAMILYPAIASGSLLVIAVTAVAIFFLRKRLLGNRRPTHHAGSSSYGTEGNVGFENQAFGQTNSIPGNEPEYMEIGSLQQPRVGFNNLSFEPGDHYQALNNKNAGHNDVYERLDFSGQSEA
ncbi:PREDICTED: sushi, von Willebrand factor type A, EGF and pentraxin domain-containing protein 1-like [Acropora digitifera]|uniref:sushi, von Willebrand factor type A, EGF and pentraxin domain-containing protein 1-like n=1 Tax=Acropora digitifera TaxID=70779 RepID=UPI00077A73CA|nr:PREDICTED: sushi, von Willebrand factor type A, EGF and pentraxin domain-containing protein 1-like [Acropora digitifera]